MTGSLINTYQHVIVIKEKGIKNIMFLCKEGQFSAGNNAIFIGTRRSRGRSRIYKGLSPII